jgi:hypothetical protein
MLDGFPSPSARRRPFAAENAGIVWADCNSVACHLRQKLYPARMAYMGIYFNLLFDFIPCRQKIRQSQPRMIFMISRTIFAAIWSFGIPVLHKIIGSTEW